MVNSENPQVAGDATTSTETHATLQEPKQDSSATASQATVPMSTATTEVAVPEVIPADPIKVAAALAVLEKTEAALQKAEFQNQQALKQMRDVAQSPSFESGGKYYQVRSKGNGLCLVRLEGPPVGRKGRDGTGGKKKPPSPAASE